MTENLPIALQEKMAFKSLVKQQNKEKFQKLTSIYEKEKAIYERSKKEKQKILDALEIQNQNLKAEKKEIKQKNSSIEEENQILLEQIQSIQQEILLMEEREEQNLQNLENNQQNLLEDINNFKSQANFTLSQIKSSKRAELIDLNNKVQSSLTSVKNQYLKKFDEALLSQEESNKLLIDCIESKFSQLNCLSKIKETQLNDYQNYLYQRKFDEKNDLLILEEKLFKIIKQFELEKQNFDLQKKQILQQQIELEEQEKNLITELSQKRQQFTETSLDLEQLRQQEQVLLQQIQSLTQTICHQKISSQDLIQIEHDKKNSLMQQNLLETESIAFKINQKKKKNQSIKLNSVAKKLNTVSVKIIILKSD